MEADYQALQREYATANAKYQELRAKPVSYTHLRAHETVLDLVCRLLLEKKKTDYLFGTCLTYTLTNHSVVVRVCLRATE